MESGGIGSRRELLLVVAMAASLFLPQPGALLGFALFGGLWLWDRRRTRRARAVVFLAGVALLLLAADWVSRPRQLDREQFRRRVEAAYRATWDGLDATATRVVERLGTEPRNREERLRAFEIFSEEAGATPQEPATVLLFDGTGEVVAWAGKGLLHELDAADLPAQGRTSYASFGAVSLIAIRPLPATAGPWRVAVGRSLSTDRFPFARLIGPMPRWTVAATANDEGVRMLRLELESGPSLLIDDAPSFSVRPAGFLEQGWQRGAQVAWGVALLTLAFQGLARVTAVVGLVLVTLAAAPPWWSGLLFVLAGGLAFWSWTAGPRIRGTMGSMLLGVAAMCAGPAVGAQVSRWGALPDMGSEIWSSPGDLIGRLGLFLLVWGLLSQIGGRRRKSEEASWNLLALSLLSLLLSVLLLDLFPAALTLLILAGGSFALWRNRHPFRQRHVNLTMLGLVAALTSAGGWEISFREHQKSTIRESLLPSVAPPTSAEIQALADEMEAFLGARDLETLSPTGAGRLSRQDLAFELWHHSPLVSYGGLSALRVLPQDGDLSSFSFGLPLNDEGWVDWSLPLWGSTRLPIWEDAILVGDGHLRVAGEPWAYIEYALVLQPGFRLPVDREEDLAAGLLRAGPRAQELRARGLEGVLYGLFGAAGEPLVGPWKQTPRLPAELLTGGELVVATPEGPASAFSSVGADGVRVLFLPRLSVTRAFERVATHALSALLALVVLTLAFQLPAVGRRGLKASWFSLWHSYSRRLALVYSALLLVPLVLINLLVVRMLEERLVDRHEAAGQEALESAQRVLGDYVLALQPGFGVDAALNDELLSWLARVVRHDVNLYWRGSVYASSKAELFTAGLLPRRIPGEIFSRLTLLGHDFAMRTGQAGGAEYLELYAPLTVPGVPVDRARLFLSMPLLAQQEETEQQITALRRRALLAALAVMLLIVGLGVRLAREFTAPLTEIVEGTQRIAGGESSLGLRPTELELSMLVDAIDDMAARIHEGRQQLLREKSVVERMVDNITSGVISLDAARRALMANRVAIELVGIGIGEELDKAVARNDRLARLADFLKRVDGRQIRQETVQLEGPDGADQEWSLVWVPLPGAGEPSALLVLEDVTEVLRAQRLQAWAEMARMIAHEIKNPLTPIRLSAEHMREIFASDPENFAAVFESCTANILLQVGELQEIAGEFSTYSRIPKIEPRSGDLVGSIAKIVEGYQAAPTRGIKIQFRAEPQTLKISFDAKLLGRAVRNLIENALRATPDGGVIEIKVEPEDGAARISVSDTGPGVREALLSRIFDPYFSTYDSGTGLGLPIASRIAAEHGGEITARNRPQGGLEVTITLPLEST